VGILTNEATLPAKHRNGPWQRDELILALDFYLRHRFTCPGKNSDEIVDLSNILGDLAKARNHAGNLMFRNSNGVYMKMMNFRRFDPHYQEKGHTGLKRGNKMEQEVWSEFFHNRAALAKEADKIIRLARGVDSSTSHSLAALR
jgi:predicted HNH restriction endonuclease